LAQALPQSRRRAGQAQALFAPLVVQMAWQMEANEQTPLMEKEVDDRLGQADKSAGSGSLWETVGPITSAVMTLPVLLAH